MHRLKVEKSDNGVDMRVHNLRVTPAMGTKLTSANPYLRDPKMRKHLVFISVASFSAIEGIHAPFKQPLTVDRPLPKSRAVKNKSSR